MKSEYVDIISGILKLKKWQVENTVKLLGEGATVPFISCYHKEATYVDDRIGLPTLKDIIEELAKPGREPREKISAFEFKKGIKSIEDLQTGMILPGIVTNVTLHRASPVASA